MGMNWVMVRTSLNLSPHTSIRYKPINVKVYFTKIELWISHLFNTDNRTALEHALYLILEAEGSILSTLTCPLSLLGFSRFSLFCAAYNTKISTSTRVSNTLYLILEAEGSILSTLTCPTLFIRVFSIFVILRSV